MRLRRADAADEAGGRLARLQRRARPDLGREHLTFACTLAPAASSSSSSSSSSAGRPALFPTSLPPHASGPQPDRSKKTTAAGINDPHALRLRELDRQVAEARALSLLASSASSPSLPSAADAATAKRDVDRAAGALLLSPSPTSSCSFWWDLRARELDALGRARVGQLEESLAERDALRAEQAAARVSAAVARASAPPEEGRLRGRAGGRGGAGGGCSSVDLRSGSAMVLWPRRRRRPDGGSAGATPAAAAAALPPSPPHAATPSQSQQHQQQARPTRAERRETERVAALDLVWQAHRHVLRPLVVAAA
jgi:hypothetical protein